MLKKLTVDLDKLFTGIAPPASGVFIPNSSFCIFGPNVAGQWDKAISTYGQSESDSQYLAQLERVFSKFCDFLNSDEQKHNHLMAGKIQSGKTAHMIYTIAWATDNNFEAIVLFTGATRSLNNQTIDRLRTEIGNPSDPNRLCSVIEIPPQSEQANIANVKNQISIKKPIPVLLCLKNVNRISALEEVLQSLPRDARILVIDDEADQISQDGNSNKASKEESTIVHEKLASLYRNDNHKTLWTSYTATPQAVFLTDRDGRLRPSEVSVIPPRAGYFGLQDLIDNNFCSVVNPELEINSLDSATELEEAIWDTLISAAILKYAPEVFYNGALGSATSVQMLVHTSNKTEVHRANFNVVSTVLKHLQSKAGIVQFNEQFARYMKTLRNANLAESTQAKLPELYEILNSNYDDFAETLLNAVHVSVINSQTNRDSEDRPVSTEDYAKHPVWIVIGGDIVGRGVTLPTLVTSYHLRRSRKNNFDTVLQQMRICGYRASYSHMLRFYTTDQIREMLEEMAYTDAVLWNQMEKWDQERTDLSNSEGIVFFAAPSDSEYEATRKNVLDKNTNTETYDGDAGTFFSLRQIFDPKLCAENLEALVAVMDECYGERVELHGEEWVVLNQIDDLLLQDWKGNGVDKKHLRLLQSLFNMPEGTEFMSRRHIMNFPNSLIFPAKALEILAAGKEQRLARYLESLNRGGGSVKDLYTYNSRLVANSGGQDFGSQDPRPVAGWIKIFNEHASGTAANWTSAISQSDAHSYFSDLRMSTPHIGTPQRDAAQRLGDGLTMILEPVYGTQPKEQGGKANRIALGIALSGFYPEGQRTFNLKITSHW